MISRGPVCTAKLTQEDINQNVTPGYGPESGIGNDYEDDDADEDNDEEEEA